MLARIAYGFPSPQLIDDPNYVLGGCLIEEDAPEFFCKKCDVAVSKQEASEDFLSVAYAWYSNDSERVLQVIKFTSVPNLSVCLTLSPGETEWLDVESEEELDEVLDLLSSEGAQVWALGVDEMWVDGETVGQESYSNAAILSVWGETQITVEQLEECGTKFEGAFNKPAWFDFNSGS